MYVLGTPDYLKLINCYNLKLPFQYISNLYWINGYKTVVGGGINYQLTTSLGIVSFNYKLKLVYFYTMHLISCFLSNFFCFKKKKRGKNQLDYGTGFLSLYLGFYSSNSQLINSISCYRNVIDWG